MTALPRIRRTTVLAAAALAAALTFTACGSSDPDTDSGNSVPGAGYPVTVESAYGEVTLDKRPERILVMSPAYLDMLAELDLQPVAFATGAIPAEEFDSVYPWLAGTYDGRVAPELVTTEFKPDLEEIASYEPDLILGHSWSIPEDMYDMVSKVAPTYVGTDDGSTITEWTVDMKAVGDLIGRAEAVETALADFDAQVARYEERVPQLKGTTYNSVAVRENGYQFGSGGWLALLGLEPAENQGGYTDAPLSFENMTELSADVLLAAAWTDETRERLEGDPRFPTLPATQNGTVVFSDLAMANAATFPAPGALVYLLDRAVPILEASALNKTGQ
jgi:iron complex transport system substrate-binding protein